MTPEERFIKIENLLATVANNQARHDQGIRDLIVVSRTLLEAQTRTSADISKLSTSIAELREAQQATDEKLHILIETVDRIIRKLNK